jgi:hypothetical protein
VRSHWSHVGLIALTAALAACAAPPLTLGTAAPAIQSQAVALSDQPGLAEGIAAAVIRKDPFGLLSRQLPAPKADKLATVLSYRAMDSDIGDGLVKHLNNLEEAGSTLGANVVAFSDGPEDGDSVVHYLRHDRSPGLVSPFVPASMIGKGARPTDAPAEVNSADPETLRRFLDWGFDRFPGRFKVLDVASHGAGYQGLCLDFHSDYKRMSLPDFGRAVHAGLKGRKLDVLNLLACMMGSLEVAWEVRDTASVLVASEDVIMGNEMLTYGPTLAPLSARTAMTAQELGKQLVIAANPTNPKTGAYTLAAIDLERITGCKSALNTLGRSLLQAMPQHKAAILAAYEATPVMQLDKGQSSHRDLFRFCNALLAKPLPGAVLDAANAQRAAIKAAMIHTRAKADDRSATYGLSVYMPTRDEEWDAAYDATQLARQTVWPQVLKALRR